MSMAVTSSVRPGKRKRVMAHAAATPKTRLHSTASGATMSVSRIAWRVSGSAVRFRQYVADAVGQGLVEHAHNRNDDQHRHREEGQTSSA